MRLAGRRGFLSAAALMVAVAVREAGSAATIIVTCSTQEATLGVNYSSAWYHCQDNDPGVQMDGVSLLVNVDVDKLILDLQGSSVTTLNFFALNETRTLDFTNRPNFASFSQLSNLTFEGVAFEPASVELALANTVTGIHFINSTLSDLSLSDYSSNLTKIDLSNTSVYKLPRFLYERKLNDNMEIFVDLSEVNETISLNLTQSTNLEANAKTLSAQGWANHYHSNCTTSPPSDSSAMTVSHDGRTNVTLSCNLPDLLEIESSKNGSSSGSNDVNAGDSSSGISTGALVAIIVVVVVIAVVLAVLILRIYFKREAANASAHNNEASATLMSKGDAAADKGSFISNDEFLRNFRLPQSDVALVKSQGTGRLWMGEYNGNKVMVKRVESEVTDSYVTKALMAQARTFATISHPNITSLVGVTWLAGTDFAVVTEFMDKGNLKTVLANTDVDLDITTKLQICCDVALALAYLHETEQNLCAKQLSSRKVLVNKAMNCKLSLFECVPSSAKLGGPSTAATYSYGMGEVAWLPPEIITRSSPMDARKINIYAFGVLVSEIFTRMSPYQSLVEAMGNTMSDVELVKRVRRQDPLVPHENRQEFLAAPASVRQMVEQCLSYAPMSRPTAKDLVEILHNSKEELAMDSI
ncbi:hypothetical protein JG688_00000493 [Phytophthora aleatoria]|uniref:Protein kinase domain-containing protein n=1 Tax=Phytophthora aleatoria TaxID=2496075 RepID=A0A8J5MC86_9STRA|nr:hypothetical protein JG688_00000493 [Phytophthora aleatoria]